MTRASAVPWLARPFALVGLALLGACSSAAPTPDIKVACGDLHPNDSTGAAGAAASSAPATPDSTAGAPALGVKPEDVLELIVVIDSVPSGPGQVMVRVDRLDEPGVVKFFMPPPTAAAAGMTLAPPPVFQGCAAISAPGLELHSPAAPRGRAWVRASTNRAVRVRLHIGSRKTEEPLLIDPGTSGIVRWEGA